METGRYEHAAAPVTRSMRRCLPSKSVPLVATAWRGWEGEVEVEVEVKGGLAADPA